MGIKSVGDLKVYNIAFELAMKIIDLTLSFSREEQYSLTDQIRRSSRSVAINIREGFAKRRYKNVFIRHLNDALGSSIYFLSSILYHLSSHLNRRLANNKSPITINQ